MLPPQSTWAEHIVGFVERGMASDARELNAALTSSVDGPVPHLTDHELERILSLRTRLIEQWQRLAPGETLSVDFPVRA